MASSLYLIGDIHGHRLKLIDILRRAGLINDRLRWSGRSATLCFLGDFVDRGDDGIGVLDLIIRLQQEAAEVGGQVLAVIGNHDLLMLSACWFPERINHVGKTCKSFWVLNGGKEMELERLTDKHIAWLQQLPALLLLQDKLVIHADTLMYYDYGSSIEAVNLTIAGILQTQDFESLMKLLEHFTQRMAFVDGRLDGIARARQFLQTYGGSQIIHGHTPIPKITNKPAVLVMYPQKDAQGHGQKWVSLHLENAVLHWGV